jgi:hypothetical protein
MNLHPEAKSGFETRPLDEPTGIGEEQQQDDLGQLMISEVGPMVKLSATSVAVGFGTVVKVISVGHEHFDKALDDIGQLGAGALLNLTVNRRKKLSAGSGKGSTAAAAAVSAAAAAVKT